MIIIHAQAEGQVGDLPPDLLADGDLIVLAGPVAAFDGLALPEPAGKVGGNVLRLTLLQPQPSGFALLAECATLFAPVLARHSGPLRYHRAGADRDPKPVPRDRPVGWRCDRSGAVTAFHLAPDVANSPLLQTVTQDLRAADLPDDRRFAFLAAAFAGA